MGILKAMARIQALGRIAAIHRQTQGAVPFLLRLLAERAQQGVADTLPTGLRQDPNREFGHIGRHEPIARVRWREEGVPSRTQAAAPPVPPPHPRNAQTAPLPPNPANTPPPGSPGPD